MKDFLVYLGWGANPGYLNLIIPCCSTAKLEWPQKRDASSLPSQTFDFIKCFFGIGIGGIFKKK